MSKILAFAGSTRRESFNRKLIQCAATAIQSCGGEVTVLELGEFELPLYNQDLEQQQGLPENALRLKRIFEEHQGLLIASPEYNSSLSPLLKNTIDWISRPSGNEPSLTAFRGKVASLLSASPGALGGLRGLVHLRSILSNIGVLVLPQQYALSKAHEQFAEDGTLSDSGQQDKVASICRSLVETVSKLS